AVALRIDALDVLSVFQKHRSHVLRRERACAALRRGLHRIECGFRAAARFARACEVSRFEEVAIELWRVELFAFRALRADDRFDKQLRVTIRLRLFEIASRAAPGEFHFICGQTLVSSPWVVCFRL